ncbi:MAG: DedA family protein [Flavobacteriia bacterium]|nr:DedA family protein [Flavobacteriia bacterium]
MITLGYTSLLFITFLSATILPFSSEVVLVSMLNKGYSIPLCLLIATTGNSLGGLTNYFIGKIGNPLWLKKVGMSEIKIQNQQLLVQKYGYWLALIAWVPIIGDPLMITVGFYRVKFMPFFSLMILGKALRYIAIATYFI